MAESKIEAERLVKIKYTDFNVSGSSDDAVISQVLAEIATSSNYKVGDVILARATRVEAWSFVCLCACLGNSAASGIFVREYQGTIYSAQYSNGTLNYCRTI